MGIFSRWFGSNKYNDAQIVSQAMTAIATDPLVNDTSSLVVTSNKGVVTISGSVHRRQERDRIEGVIRNSLTNMSLKHERIVNEVRLPHETTPIK